MTDYLAEDFRKIVNKLNEYMLMTTESDPEDDISQDANTDSSDDTSDDTSDDASQDGESTDELLTTDSNDDKLTGNIDTAALIKLLDIPTDQQRQFQQAVALLKNENPALTTEQANIITSAFKKLLTLASDKKAAFHQITKPVAVVKENENADLPTGDLKNLVSCISNIAKSSPTARLHAIKAIQHLSSGMKDRNKDGGIKDVIENVVDILNLAKIGKEVSALKGIAKMVNRLEGDEHAMDGTSFPQLVTELILLVGEVLQQSKHSASD